VQDHAADQLDVEMAQCMCRLPDLADDREGLRQQIVERLTAPARSRRTSSRARSSSSLSSSSSGSKALISATRCS